MYYDGSRPLNSDCPFIFSNGNRSTGKSFNWKRYVLNRYVKNKEEFLYLRRTGEDIKRAIPKWFEDISFKFPNLEITTEKHTFYNTKPIAWDDDGNPTEFERERMGYYFSLGETIKSIPFEKVTTIFFDEYLPDDGRYLHASNPFWEPEQLLNIYMTVARGVNKPIRDNVKLVCVANNISIYNPYFNYFGIDLSGYDGSAYYSVVNNGVYAEMVFNEEIAKAMAESKIGGILERTRYGQHATQNQALLDTQFNIVPKLPDKLHYELGLYTPFGWVSCWSDGFGALFWRDGADKQNPNRFKTVPIPDYPFSVPYLQGFIYKNMRNVFLADKMYYENGHVKAAVAGLFATGPQAIKIY